MTVAKYAGFKTRNDMVNQTIPHHYFMTMDEVMAAMDAGIINRFRQAEYLNPILLTTRPGEVQLRIVDDAGRCSVCWKPVTEAWFSWDHRVTHEMYRPGMFIMGEDLFSAIRHTDGSENCGSFMWSLPRCDKCGTWCSLTTQLQAYGDLTKCLACGNTNWYDIGD